MRWHSTGDERAQGALSSTLKLSQLSALWELSARVCADMRAARDAVHRWSHLHSLGGTAQLAVFPLSLSLPLRVAVSALPWEA